MDLIKFFDLGGVGSAIFGLSLGLENFPYKSQFFNFFPFRAKKSLWVGSKKYPGPRQARLLFTEGQKYAWVRLDQGPSQIQTSFWITKNQYFPIQINMKEQKLYLPYYLPIIMLFKQVVQEYERSVIFRLGRLRKGGAKGPGIFFIIPCIDTYRKVDLRTVSFDVPPQEVCIESWINKKYFHLDSLWWKVLSRDSVTVTVDAVVYYRVSNPTMATNNVEDFRWQNPVMFLQ